MSKVRIELNSAGIREMLRSSEMQALLAERAAEIAMRAGDGYSSDTYLTGGRAIASAFAETKEAYRDNLDNNTLLRSLQ